jgi:NTP pyrophosphatase (non-canonical NTP hydrolase)
MYNALIKLQDDIHAENVAAGWWTDPETGEDLRDPKHLKKTLGWKLLLAHSEISEAAEGLRKGLNDDKLPHRSMMEVEIADTIIRLLDIAGANGLDVAGAIQEKRAFNAQRSDHKMENRKSKGGKAF